MWQTHFSLCSWTLCPIRCKSLVLFFLIDLLVSLFYIFLHITFLHLQSLNVLEWLIQKIIWLNVFFFFFFQVKKMATNVIALFFLKLPTFSIFFGFWIIGTMKPLLISNVFQWVNKDEYLDCMQREGMKSLPSYGINHVS